MERYRAQKAATTPPVLPLSVQMRVAAEMAAPEIRGFAEMIGTEWQAEALRLEGGVATARAELLAEVTAALRSEGYIYRSYGPRAADFIDSHFGGQ